MANARTPGHLGESNNSGTFKDPIPFDKGLSHHGLRTRPLAPGTIEITAGTLSAGVNTVTATVNGIDISAVIDWGTSHAATATALGVSINAFANGATPHNYVATVAAAVVTIRQRTSGAITGALAAVVGGDVTTTDVDFTIDTDTWTELVSGATQDGNEYYELGFDGGLVYDGDLAGSDDMFITSIEILVDGQAWAYYMNGLRANATASALVPGAPIATAVFEKVEWLGAQANFIIKLAADEELLYKARYI